jgi:hypothetical protein
MNDKEYINHLEYRVEYLKQLIYLSDKSDKQTKEELKKWIYMAMEFQEKFVELKNKEVK